MELLYGFGVQGSFNPEILDVIWKICLSATGNLYTSLQPADEMAFGTSYILVQIAKFESERYSGTFKI